MTCSPRCETAADALPDRRVRSSARLGTVCYACRGCTGPHVARPGVLRFRLRGGSVAGPHASGRPAPGSRRGAGPPGRPGRGRTPPPPTSSRPLRSDLLRSSGCLRCRALQSSWWGAGSRSARCAESGRPAFATASRTAALCAVDLGHRPIIGTRQQPSRVADFGAGLLAEDGSVPVPMVKVTDVRVAVCEFGVLVDM